MKLGQIVRSQTFERDVVSLVDNGRVWTLTVADKNIVYNKSWRTRTSRTSARRLQPVPRVVDAATVLSYRFGGRRNVAGGRASRVQRFWNDDTFQNVRNEFLAAVRGENAIVTRTRGVCSSRKSYCGQLCFDGINRMDRITLFLVRWFVRKASRKSRWKYRKARVKSVKTDGLPPPQTVYAVRTYVPNCVRSRCETRN